MPPIAWRGPIKFILVGPNGELHETRAKLPDLENLRAGDEVEAEDFIFGFKLFFVVRRIDQPKPDDPRFTEAKTWVYLEMAR